MKEFIQNSSNLIIRKFSVHNILNERSSDDRINGILNSNLEISKEGKDTLNKLGEYLDEFDILVESIYSAIEEKIIFMETYCDAITSNAKQIPSNTLGSIYIYNGDIELDGMTYIKDTGYILGVD